MARRLIFYVLVTAFVWIVVSRFTEVRLLAATLASGRPLWVLVAALLQVLYYAVFTGMYQSGFDTVGVRTRTRDLVPVLLASMFVNVAAPTGGASGAALFVDDLTRRGHQAGRAAAGTVLILAADFTAFTLTLLPGLVALFLVHELKSYEVAAALVLVLIAGGLTGLLLAGMSHPGRVRHLLAWVRSLVGRPFVWLGRPGPLSEEWADRTADDFGLAAQAAAAQPGRVARTLGLGLAANALDLASLYALFLAFSQPVSFGTLIAGYGIGILFWIVSITPQGIGVTEGAMALVYTSLGVPAAAATIIALVFRGLTFWLPMLAGLVLLRRVKTFHTEPDVRLEVWSVRLAAVLATVMGAVNVLSAATPGLADRLVMIRQFVPLAVRHGSRMASVLSGFALLLLARHLWRHKRVAWLLTLGALVVSVVTHLLKGLDYEEAVLAGGLAAWLLSLRGHFQALSDRASVQQGLGTLGGALAFTLAYGATGFYLLDRHFSVIFDLPAALRQTVVMFTEFSDPGLQPVTAFGRHFATSIYAVAIATFAFALLRVLQPVVLRGAPSAELRARARRIVEAHGRSSLARFALFDDKTYYFSPGGSMIAYTVKGRVALALGDPIGPPEDVAAAVAGWQALCARHDWRPAFYQTLPDFLETYRQAGFEVLCVGYEGIVDVQHFSLEGSTHKDLRYAVNRARKTGLRAELHEPPLGPGLLEQLRSVSDEWLTMMKGSEKRFSLGWFDDDYIRQCPVMAVHTPEGGLSAFANLVPEYQLNEAGIDLMRRRDEIAPGTMDYLFASLLQWARERGYETFNLGLSPLAGVGQLQTDPALERAVAYLYGHLNPFYSFQGLHAFKEKFRPQWSPRYLVYAGTAGLPAVVLALVRAGAGDDFAWKYARELLAPGPKARSGAAANADS